MQVHLLCKSPSAQLRGTGSKTANSSVGEYEKSIWNGLPRGFASPRYFKKADALVAPPPRMLIANWLRAPNWTFSQPRYNPSAKLLLTKRSSDVTASAPESCCLVEVMLTKEPWSGEQVNEQNSERKLFLHAGHVDIKASACRRRS